MRHHINYLFIILMLLPILPIKVNAKEGSAEENVKTNPSGVLDNEVVARVVDYINKSNKNKLTTRPNFSLLGGPYYTSEKGFGLGFVVAGDYSTSPEDTLQPTSNIALAGSVATNKYFSVGVTGTHVFPKDTRRINYMIDFVSFGTYFWGIGYDWGNDNANKTKYQLFNLIMEANYAWRLGNNVFLGPAMEVSYSNAHGIKNYSPWEGEDLRYWTVSAGLLLQSDTRDNLTAPKRGHFFELTQLFSPRFLGNGNHSFSSTELCYNRYTPLWRGCTLASRIHGEWTFGHTPWGDLPSIDGEAIRAYYRGRYRDKCETDIYFEFRQHIYGRSGVAVWGGASTIYHKLSDISIKRLLPEAGIGYRWEFKKNTNIRIDFGFGKHSSGFLFGINEAF